ncbi:hypothetical protein GCK32_005745 [Trichostrongylus colubriformis]|uniref:Uncharacterized protein n=1 Tax=Trichostrongylus colubriformis TaxID=6319 RepID=A0AAN8FWT6_TRICO
MSKTRVEQQRQIFVKMRSAVALIVVAAVVLVQCQDDWVARYKNVRAHAFHPNSASGVGAELYVPQTISDVTGKVNQLRRQLFSWQAPRDTDFFHRR